MTQDRVRWTWLRVMYAANIVGAGVPGFLVTFFPTFAEAYLFGGAVQDGLVFGVTGSVWLAIGALSVLGLRYPVQLAGIFLVQVVYKTVWTLAVGLPLTFQGDPRALPFVLFFALVTAGFLYALPFGYLFGRNPANTFVGEA